MYKIGIFSFVVKILYFILNKTFSHQPQYGENFQYANTFAQLLKECRKGIPLFTCIRASLSLGPNSCIHKRTHFNVYNNFIIILKSKNTSSNLNFNGQAVRFYFSSDLPNACSMYLEIVYPTNMWLKAELQFLHNNYMGLKLLTYLFKKIFSETEIQNEF
jgi:hypothetical protein